jgi:hypothetical protein
MSDVDYVRPRHRARDNRASDNEDWRKVARLYVDGYSSELDDDFTESDQH